jgi:hypothetical protein
MLFNDLPACYGWHMPRGGKRDGAGRPPGLFISSSGSMGFGSGLEVSGQLSRQFLAPAATSFCALWAVARPTFASFAISLTVISGFARTAAFARSMRRCSICGFSAFGTLSSRTEATVLSLHAGSSRSRGCSFAAPLGGTKRSLRVFARSSSDAGAYSSEDISCRVGDD